MKRQRGRSRNTKPQNPNRAMESNGPGIKVRGAAPTIYEKYQQLARDASLAGDRVMAENYLQFAEHYFRIMRTQQAQREQREEEQAAQRTARQAQYDARKAQQPPQQQPQQAPPAEMQRPAPTQQKPAAQSDKTEATPPPDSNNGTTGPMDIVMPEAIPEPLATKPARTPRRRVRRPGPDAEEKAKVADEGGKTPV